MTTRRPTIQVACITTQQRETKTLLKVETGPAFRVSDARIVDDGWRRGG